MKTSLLVTLLQIAALLHAGLICAGASMPRAGQLRAHLPALPVFIRRLFFVYFGFIGLALAWQAAFFVIAKDPIRFRLMMVAAILEKFSDVITVAALFAQGRLQSGQLAPAVADLALGILFIAAFLKTSAGREIDQRGHPPCRPLDS